MVPYPHKGICADFGKLKPDPNQMRWQPQAFPTEPVDFVDGITTMGERAAARLDRAAGALA